MVLTNTGALLPYVRNETTKTTLKEGEQVVLTLHGRIVNPEFGKLVVMQEGKDFAIKPYTGVEKLEDGQYVQMAYSAQEVLNAAHVLEKGQLDVDVGGAIKFVGKNGERWGRWMPDHVNGTDAQGRTDFFLNGGLTTKYRRIDETATDKDSPVVYLPEEDTVTRIAGGYGTGWTESPSKDKACS